jgi:AcrR family transcriptional regulator
MPLASAAPKIRDDILDAAERLLARFGYKKMTMDDLAREAGIGKGTTYLHFRGKKEVALGTIDRVVQRLLVLLDEIVESGESPPARVRQMLLTRILFRFDSARNHSESLDDLLRAVRPAYLARRQRYFDAEAKVFLRVLEDGRKTRVFSFDDGLATAHALLLATNALLPSSLSARELGKRRDVEAKTARIADLLIAGLERH